MNELTVNFDKKISLKEFDKQIPKLVKNFPSKINLLIKVRIKMDCILLHLKKILIKMQRIDGSGICKKPSLYRLAVLVSSKGRTRPLKRVSIVTQLVTVNP